MRLDRRNLVYPAFLARIGYHLHLAQCLLKHELVIDLVQHVSAQKVVVPAARLLANQSESVAFGFGLSSGLQLRVVGELSPCANRVWHPCNFLLRFFLKLFVFSSQDGERTVKRTKDLQEKLVKALLLLGCSFCELGDFARLFDEALDIGFHF